MSLILQAPLKANKDLKGTTSSKIRPKKHIFDTYLLGTLKGNLSPPNFGLQWLKLVGGCSTSTSQPFVLLS